MLIKEVAASLYAWDIADEGIDTIVETLVERCMTNSIYLVGVMHHEKRPLTSLFFTHNPKRKYYLPENSRAYYRLDMESFKNTKLKPMFTERTFLQGTDWLDVVVNAARKRGLRAGVELSHTLFDTDIALRDYPDTMQRNVHGEVIGGFLGMLCSNHPDVREYQKAMFYDTVKNHDIDFIQTCLITFSGGNRVSAPWFFKEWMNIDKAPLGELLGMARGGCFCKNCEALARKMGYDWDLIMRDMKTLNAIANATALHNQDYLMENHLTLGSNATESLLLIEYPGLMEFLKFRIDSVTQLFKEIYTTVHEVRPDIDFRYNNFVQRPEYTGISFKRIAPYVDSVRDCEYSEHFGAPDNFVFKRNSLLGIRRGIGFDKDLIAAIAIRPNATPEIIHKSLQVLSTVGIDGISLGHYDCAHFEHLDAVGDGLKLAQMKVCRR